jgi:ubiquitin-conjugating enzyme E2 J1
VYFGKVELPNEYPLKAPDFYFHTPNGRFELNRKICTTFSSFHNNEYTSTWNIRSMMNGMISFMTDRDPELGIGSLNSDDQTKQQYAQHTMLWNLENELCCKIFPNLQELISSQTKVR